MIKNDVKKIFHFYIKQYNKKYSNKGPAGNRLPALNGKKRGGINRPVLIVPLCMYPPISALHASGSKATDQILFNAHKQDNYRHDRK